MEFTIHWGHGFDQDGNAISQKDANSKHPTTSWIKTREVAEELLVRALHNTFGSCCYSNARKALLKITNQFQTERKIVLQFNPVEAQIFIKDKTPSFGKEQKLSNAEDLERDQYERTVTNLLYTLNCRSERTPHFNRAYHFCHLALCLDPADKLQLINGIFVTKASLLQRALALDGSYSFARDHLEKLLMPPSKL